MSKAINKTQSYGLLLHIALQYGLVRFLKINSTVFIPNEKPWNVSLMFCSNVYMCCVLKPDRELDRDFRQQHQMELGLRKIRRPPVFVVKQNERGGDNLAQHDTRTIINDPLLPTHAHTHIHGHTQHNPCTQAGTQTHEHTGLDINARFILSFSDRLCLLSI